jgi:hypothetical protein
VEQAREDLMNACSIGLTNSIAGGSCSLARSDTYADHEYGGGSKYVACSLARSDTYADHEYGGGSKYGACSLARSDTYADHEYGQGSKATSHRIAKYTHTPSEDHPMDGSNAQLSEDHPMDGSNAKPSEDDGMGVVVNKLTFKTP